jgi:Reverse transcriptase (RNA-dependent DNA polymerase)
METTMWTDIMAYINTIKNHIKHYSTQQIPYEEYYQQPSILRFHQFGKAVIIYNLNTHHKLEPRGLKGKFIGYNPHNTKSFKILLENGKMIYSNDVKFIEESEVFLVDKTDIPSHFNVANQQEIWRTAMDTELQQLISMGTFTVNTIPKNQKAISTKWVYTIKTDTAGNYVKHKARLVARGFEQIYGINYTETFAPVVSHESIRLLCGITARQPEWGIYQTDFKNAYIQGTLQELVHIQIPALPSNTQAQDTLLKWIGKAKPDKHEQSVLTLRKALYGLKQSGRTWNQTITRDIIRSGLEQSKLDPCTFFNSNLHFAIYVDDGYYFGRQRDTNELDNILRHKYQLDETKQIESQVGIHYQVDKQAIHMDQINYIKDILEKYGMIQCKPKSTPIDGYVENTPNTNELNPDFRTLIGELLFIARHTRPDITYAVQYMARFTNNSNKELYSKAKQILRYLAGTIDMHIIFTRNNGQKPAIISCFVDASFADCIDGTSTFGYIIFLDNNPIIWNSKKQNTTAQSTVESEYIGTSFAAREVMWIKQRLDEINIEYETPIIYNDNQSTINAIKNRSISKYSKHIRVKYHYIRELYHNNEIRLEYMATDDMIADIFTKPLCKPKFEKHRNSLLSLSFN